MAQVANTRCQSKASIASLLCTSKELRYWSAPRTILAITNLLDEETLLFHAVKQARQSAAKIVLVHVFGGGSVSSEPAFTIQTARSELDRMARQLRWVGIPCEAVFLKDAPPEEICRIVASRHVDRVLVAEGDGEDGMQLKESVLGAELLAGIGVPICVIGRSVQGFSQKQRPTGRITVGLSLHSDDEILLGFASRFAQENHARLTVLHASSGCRGNVRTIDQTAAAVTACLPAQALREAQLLCTMEIVVRQGDPETVLLEYCVETNTDFLILGPSGPSSRFTQAGAGGIPRIVNQARCPVIILGQFASATGDSMASFAAPKPPLGVRA